MNAAWTRRSRLGATLIATFLLGLAGSSAANAANSIYWVNYNSGSISHANLGGGGGGTVSTAGATPLVNPYGLTFDPSATKLYVANAEMNKISFASLLGGAGGDLNTTGAETSFPDGLSIDPVTRRIYWANAGSDSISYTSLDGAGGGNLNTTGAEVEGPEGVVVDHATGRVYWANNNGPKISYANLDGSGGGNLDTTGAAVNDPVGVAIDPVAGKIYWANTEPDSIAFANLAGGGGGMVSTSGATLGYPNGLAIDPTAGRVYWASYFGGALSYANLNGSGGGDIVTTGATVDGPAFPIVLEDPIGTGAPAISGGSNTGSTLTCSQGSWAADLPEAFLFRGPTAYAYQWSKGGQPVSGAVAATFTPTKAGSYACQVAATNASGASSQASAAFKVIVAKARVKKVKLNMRKGTALLFVSVSGPGRLTLGGKGVTHRQKSAGKAATLKLLLKVKGKKKQLLSQEGKATLRIKLAFKPSTGTGAKLSKRIVLKKQLVP